MCISQYPSCIRAYLIEIGLIMAELSQNDAGVDDDAADGLVDFMRQGCREFSHSCHPVDAGEIALRLTPGLFAPSLVIDIGRGAGKFENAAFGIAQDHGLT